MPQLLVHEVTEDRIAELVNDIHKHDNNPPSDEVKKEETEAILRGAQGHIHWRNSLPIQEQLALVNVPVVSVPDDESSDAIPAASDVNQPSNESGQTGSTDLTPVDITEQNAGENL